MRMITVILAVVLATATALAQVAVPPPPQPASESHTNAAVLRLLRAGVSESSILYVISVAAGTFDTSADALAALKQAGASEAELSAIVSQGAAPTNAPPVGAQTNNGPSLAETMKYIQDKMNQQGKIVFTRFYRDPATGESSSSQCSEEDQVIAVDPAGGLFFQSSGEYTNNNDTDTWRLNFKDVGKLEVLSGSDAWSRNNPEYEYQISPQYFYLYIHFIAGRTVQVHVIRVLSGKHGKPTSSDSSTREIRLAFRDEESADRAAKAIIHAVELCGGGSKPELF
jgi:hypothetical protein